MFFAVWSYLGFVEYVSALGCTLQHVAFHHVQCLFLQDIQFCDQRMRKGHAVGA